MGDLVNVFIDFFASIVGEFLILRRRKKLSVKAHEMYGAGLPARISGCFYGFSSRNSSSWIGGVIVVQPGAITWHPGYFRRRRGKGHHIGAAEFTAISLRMPATRESWAVDAKCVVLIGEVDGRRVEIAVLQDDMSLLLDALKATRLLDD